MFCIAHRRPHGKSVLEGVKSCTSTWRRNGDLSTPSRVKAAGNYHNSRLAHVEARLNGFSSPLMLNERGKVSEGPASCFMMIRNGTVFTPPVTANILESRSRARRFIDLCRDDLRCRGNRTRDRPHRGLYRRRGFLLRQRRGGHTDALARPLSTRRGRGRSDQQAHPAILFRRDSGRVAEIPALAHPRLRGVVCGHAACLMSEV